MEKCTECRKGGPARRGTAVVRWVLGLTLLLVVPVAGQAPIPQFPSTNNGKVHHNPDPNTTIQAGPEVPQDPKRLRALNAERQKEVVSDTEKLLKLARELNDSVASADSGAMNDTQVRKVAEIEKLAKSVREKMSFSVGTYPTVRDPATEPPGVE